MRQNSLCPTLRPTPAFSCISSKRGPVSGKRGPHLRTLSNAVKAWLIAYHECVTVRILCVAHRVEIPKIQAIAKFKTERPHQPTHTHRKLLQTTTDDGPNPCQYFEELASFRSNDAFTFSWRNAALVSSIAFQSQTRGSLHQRGMVHLSRYDTCLPVIIPVCQYGVRA
jgi:hypothetical protein